MKDRRALILWVVAALSLVAFVVLAGGFASSAAVRAFDVAVSEVIQSLRRPWFTSVMLGITVLGSWPVVVAGTLALTSWQWRCGRQNAAVYSVVIVAGTAVLTQLAKYEFARLRPPLASALVTLPGSFSFPSGHTTGSLSLAWALGVALVVSGRSNRGRTALLTAIALYPVLVGVSRVYLGVHWPSDVLASWLLSVAWIAAATATVLSRPAAASE